MKSLPSVIFAISLFIIHHSPFKIADSRLPIHDSRLPIAYSTANAHSHNDYEQKVPFHNAWEHGFGSIEADIFLVGDELIVAHDTSQLTGGRTLKSLYLDPLQQS